MHDQRQTMARTGRVAFFAAFVAVVGAAAWTQFTGQRARADGATSATASAAAVLDTTIQAENAARDYTVSRQPAALDAYTADRAQLERAIGRARAVLTGDDLRSHLGREIALIDVWGAAVGQDVGAATGGAAADPERAAARGEQLTRIRVAHDALLRTLDQHDRDARDAAGIRGLLVVIGCCVLFAALNWLLFVRTERRDARARDRQLAFGERLQSARSEDSARSMLARHLEDVAPGTMVLVTGPDDRSPAGRPVTSGGERVATVIIRSERDLSSAAERLVRDSIVRAGPVLATLRLLALAQARAATDPLTGLGNRRLVEDALGRMVAQSRRTGERFAVAVVDLDRFKPVNDTYGHPAGDALLIEVGRVLDDATRDYDVVGRHGGDEFIVLLSGLDATEATSVMDRCRASIAELAVGSSSPGVTASIGVAPSGPAFLGDAADLVRAADDAVYAAKARGGNCVVEADDPGPTIDPGQASALRA
jgi:diguanylate cyclase (GGDEF)-like protein